MLYFGDIALFLQDNYLSPAGRGKILGNLADPQKKIILQVELAVLVDVGEHFVKAMYSLYGSSTQHSSCHSHHCRGATLLVLSS